MPEKDSEKLANGSPSLSTTTNGIHDHHDDSTKRKIAVVGSGVAGLSAAWHIAMNASDKNEVHVFESDDRLGGHAHTITIQDSNSSNSEIDVDVGFMVYNDINYPNMIRWFDALGIPRENSDMSLSVSLDGGSTVEWNSDGLTGLLANPYQMLKPRFYTMISDMFRFNREFPKLLNLAEDDPRRYVRLGQYLRDHDYSSALAEYYLLPMIAAIWSSSIREVLDHPAEQLARFMHNHKLLQVFDRPQWKTVSNRSKTYTLKVKELIGDQNIHLSTPILSAQKKLPVKNSPSHTSSSSSSYELFTTNQVSVGEFDHVIFACHPPSAHSILQHCNGISSHLLSALSQIQYSDSHVYIHSDEELMPKRKTAWASWNCIGKSHALRSIYEDGDDNNSSSKNKGEAMEGSSSGFGATKNKDPQDNTNNNNNNNNSFTTTVLEGEDGRFHAVYPTYWLNRLQNLPKTSPNIFVSLNPHTIPKSHTIHRKQIMSHPQFTMQTLEARKILRMTQKKKNDGTNDGLWFCGAWDGYGFHEDGCRSGFDVAVTLTGVPLPWCNDIQPVLPSPNIINNTTTTKSGVLGYIQSIHQWISYDLPVTACRHFMFSFLKKAITKGTLQIKHSGNQMEVFGDGSPCGRDDSPVTLKVFDDWFFVKTAFEYDLGLARSYMAGLFVVESLPTPNDYDSILRPKEARNESNIILGDPIGLTRLFLLFIGNRDDDNKDHFRPLKSARMHSNVNAFVNASGMILSKIGSSLNYLRYKLTMNNTERGGSLRNIHAHYDLSNDLFQTFLDSETLMYSSAIYDAIPAVPSSFSNGDSRGLMFRGSLEEAQWRKLNTLLHRAQIHNSDQTLLDIGFGWGGLSIHAAKTFGCKVHGITLSQEQKALAERRVRKEGLDHLISFEIVDYRTFARRLENRGKFDRVISCEMIEAVGHDHLGDFFWAVEQVLSKDGILVMEAITTPESRYETYLRATDFMNTIIFPGGCCPSLHALVDAAYQQSTLTLEHIDNIGLHYAQTLAEWRRRFNANENDVRALGFDDVFLRVWNYYLSYCESGFITQTLSCLILVFARSGFCTDVVPLSATRNVTQVPALTDDEVKDWMSNSSSSSTETK